MSSEHWRNKKRTNRLPLSLRAQPHPSWSSSSGRQSRRTCRSPRSGPPPPAPTTLSLSTSLTSMEYAVATLLSVWQTGKRENVHTDREVVLRLTNMTRASTSFSVGAETGKNYISKLVQKQCSYNWNKGIPRTILLQLNGHIPLTQISFCVAQCPYASAPLGTREE
jgi:hypothetical protein